MEYVKEPLEAVEKIPDNAYLVKIKCLGCSETNFLQYEKPIIKNNKLFIGKLAFPFNLIEMITFRNKTIYGKYEESYKVESTYFYKFFNEKAILELEEFDKRT